MKEKIAELLKGIIDSEGPDYLTDHPYEVYLKLTEDPDIDSETAAVVLHSLVLDVAKPIRGSKRIPKDALAKLIKQKCRLSQKTSEWLVDLYLALYSKSNKAEWKENRNAGLQEFLEMEWPIEWKGYSEWHAGNVYVECKYKANFTIAALDSWKADKYLEATIKKNPFLTSEDIAQYYVDQLLEYLDDKFEYYFTCDDYYPPVAEDFEADDYVQDWCKENTFELVDFEGVGNSSDYIPNGRLY